MLSAAVSLWADGWLRASHMTQWVLERYKVADDLRTDSYIRRLRLNLWGDMAPHLAWKVDLRNDNIGYRESGTGEFQVGEAYLSIYGFLGDATADLRLYRSRIDVSRTQSIGTSALVHIDRPQVSDAAAQFVSRNRRNDNIQLNLARKFLRIQLAAGRGVEERLTDAAGVTLEGALSQKRPFYGGKIRYHRGDARQVETYFGRGSHLEVGVGYWVSPAITYRPEGAPVWYRTDHRLLNVELSMHRRGLFLQSEYFRFDGVVKDFLRAPSVTGSSWGWYLLGEYYLRPVAPFLRIERWDRYEEAGGYSYSSDLGGLHWYIRKNALKLGVAYGIDRYGERLGGRDVRSFKLTTQWMF